jgi:hypothetical protein
VVAVIAKNHCLLSALKQHCVVVEKKRTDYGGGRRPANRLQYSGSLTESCKRLLLLLQLLLLLRDSRQKQRHPSSQLTAAAAAAAATVTAVGLLTYLYKGIHVRPSVHRRLKGVL